MKLQTGIFADLLAEQRIQAATQPMPLSSGAVVRSTPYRGANAGRSTAGWTPRLLSADYETRGALIALRARCRELARNNDYALAAIELLVKNVIGPDGLRLEPKLKDDAQDELKLATEENSEIRRAWEDWGRSGQCTVDGQVSFAEVQQLALRIWAVDGECFIRKIEGFPYSRHRFALQFVDPDRVDANFNRFPNVNAGSENEVRMGVEVDKWRRPVAYWITKGHPFEGGGGYYHDRVPAAEILHLYRAERADQTRGIPRLHTAMTRLFMLGHYEESELIAARGAACIMAFLTSKTGEDYAGGIKKDDGTTEFQLEPGTMPQLPEGQDVKMFNPQHPNANYSEFVKRMLHGAASGIGVSYSSLSSDLREVNFSSIRQGLIDERDGYRVLQAFFRDRFCQPIFEAWFDLAILAKQLMLPVPDDEERLQIFAACGWQGRGWSWVDPLKDVAAAIDAIGAGLSSPQRECAKQGADFRDVIDELAEADAYAKKRNVDIRTKGISPMASGATNEPNPGQEGDTANNNKSARQLSAHPHIDAILASDASERGGQ